MFCLRIRYFYYSDTDLYFFTARVYHKTEKAKTDTMKGRK